MPTLTSTAADDSAVVAETAPAMMAIGDGPTVLGPTTITQDLIASLNKAINKGDDAPSEGVLSPGGRISGRLVDVPSYLPEGGIEPPPEVDLSLKSTKNQGEPPLNKEQKRQIEEVKKRLAKWCGNYLSKFSWPIMDYLIHHCYGHGGATIHPSTISVNGATCVPIGAFACIQFSHTLFHLVSRKQLPKNAKIPSLFGHKFPNRFCFTFWVVEVLGTQLASYFQNEPEAIDEENDNDVTKKRKQKIKNMTEWARELRQEVGDMFYDQFDPGDDNWKPHRENLEAGFEDECVTLTVLGFASKGKTRHVVACVQYIPTEHGAFIKWFAVQSFQRLQKNEYAPFENDRGSNDPSFHNIGLGSFLLLLVQMQQIASGYSPLIALQCLEKSDAEQFYINRGFKQAPSNEISSVPGLQDDETLSKVASFKFWSDDDQKDQEVLLKLWYLDCIINPSTCAEKGDDPEKHPQKLFMQNRTVDAVPSDHRHTFFPFPFNSDGKSVENYVIAGMKDEDDLFWFSSKYSFGSIFTHNHSYTIPRRRNIKTSSQPQRARFRNLDANRMYQHGAVILMDKYNQFCDDDELWMFDEHLAIVTSWMQRHPKSVASRDCIIIPQSITMSFTSLFNDGLEAPFYRPNLSAQCGKLVDNYLFYHAEIFAKRFWFFTININNRHYLSVCVVNPWFKLAEIISEKEDTLGSDASWAKTFSSKVLDRHKFGIIYNDSMGTGGSHVDMDVMYGIVWFMNIASHYRDAYVTRRAGEINFSWQGDLTRHLSVVKDYKQQNEDGTISSVFSSPQPGTSAPVPSAPVSSAKGVVLPSHPVKPQYQIPDFVLPVEHMLTLGLTGPFGNLMEADSIEDLPIPVLAKQKALFVPQNDAYNCGISFLFFVIEVLVCFNNVPDDLGLQRLGKALGMSLKENADDDEKESHNTHIYLMYSLWRQEFIAFMERMRVAYIQSDFKYLATTRVPQDWGKLRENGVQLKKGSFFNSHTKSFFKKDTFPSTTAGRAATSSSRSLRNHFVNCKDPFPVYNDYYLCLDDSSKWRNLFASFLTKMDVKKIKHPEVFKISMDYCQNYFSFDHLWDRCNLKWTLNWDGKEVIKGTETAKPPSPASPKPTSPAGPKPPSPAGPKPPSPAGPKHPTPAGPKHPSPVGPKGGDSEHSSASPSSSNQNDEEEKTDSSEDTAVYGNGSGGKRLRTQKRNDGTPSKKKKKNLKINISTDKLKKAASLPAGSTMIRGRRRSTRSRLPPKAPRPTTARAKHPTKVAMELWPAWFTKKYTTLELTEFDLGEATNLKNKISDNEFLELVDKLNDETKWKELYPPHEEDKNATLEEADKFARQLMNLPSGKRELNYVLDELGKEHNGEKLKAVYKAYYLRAVPLAQLEADILMPEGIVGLEFVPPEKKRRWSNKGEKLEGHYRVQVRRRQNIIEEADVAADWAERNFKPELVATAQRLAGEKRRRLTHNKKDYGPGWVTVDVEGREQPCVDNRQVNRIKYVPPRLCYQGNKYQKDDFGNLLLDHNERRIPIPTEDRPTRTKEGYFVGWSNKEDEFIPHLSRDWVVKQFGAGFAKHMEQNSRKHFTNVPPGAPRLHNSQVEALIPENAPKIVYKQSAGERSCMILALANALHFMGEKAFARRLAGQSKHLQKKFDLINCLFSWMRNNSKGLVIVRLDKKKAVVNPFTLNENQLHSICLTGSDGKEDHSVAIAGGFIFDANVTHALTLSKEALGLCCSTDLERAEFVACQKVYKYTWKSLKD